VAGSAEVTVGTDQKKALAKFRKRGERMRAEFPKFYFKLKVYEDYLENLSACARPMCRESTKPLSGQSIRRQKDPASTPGPATAPQSG